MELNMLSLFSGIGAFEKSLENIGIKINLINFCEIDKYAETAYCAIHKVNKKLILCIISCQDSDKITVKKIIEYISICNYKPFYVLLGSNLL